MAYRTAFAKWQLADSRTSLQLHFKEITSVQVTPDPPENILLRKGYVYRPN